MRLFHKQIKDPELAAKLAKEKELDEAVATEKRELRIVVEEMDAGIRPRDHYVLLDAEIKDAITTKEFDFYDMNWHRQKDYR